MSMQQKLESLGFHPQEAELYLASLEIGPASVQDISKHSKIHRVRCYSIIESLIEQGLMSTFLMGKKSLYVASDPDTLFLFLDKQIQDIESKKKTLAEDITELKLRYKESGGKPVVRYYEGLEGVLLMNTETFQIDNEAMFSAYDLDIVRKNIPESVRDRVRKFRIARNTQIQVLYNSDNETIPETPDRKTFRISKDKQFLADVAVIKDLVRFAVYGEQTHGVIIQSKEIAATIKHLFELAIETAKNQEKP